MATAAERPPPSQAGEPEARSAGRSARERSAFEPPFEEGHRNECGAPPDPGHGRRADVEEALARARRHGRAAAAEAIAAVRALLDAASLGVSGKPSEAHAGLATLAESLDDLAARLSGEPSDRSPTMVRTLLDALDVEIRRWEAQSAGDAEARTVLRAFLSVREILWELGLRRSEAGGTEALRRHSAQAHRPTPEGAAKEASKSRGHVGPKPPRGSGRRVQRVKV